MGRRTPAARATSVNFQFDFEPSEAGLRAVVAQENVGTPAHRDVEIWTPVVVEITRSDPFDEGVHGDIVALDHVQPSGFTRESGFDGDVCECSVGVVVEQSHLIFETQGGGHDVQITVSVEIFGDAATRKLIQRRAWCRDALGARFC